MKPNHEGNAMGIADAKTVRGLALDNPLRSEPLKRWESTPAARAIAKEPGAHRSVK
ncbi:MAG: hypothetical protein HY010_16770 [Acidobacteria bacterium]|nr:hypothetical protein [Acidobacteriota bacterium]